jgi:hypothetical protein
MDCTAQGKMASRQIRSMDLGPSAVDPSLPITVKDSFIIVLIFIWQTDNTKLPYSD